MKMHKQKSTEVIDVKTNENLQDVLLKKAMGFKVKETTQEFVMVEDELKLNKKRVSVKYYPPDLSAIDLLLKTQKDLFNFENYTDQELEEEKQKLIKKLNLLNTENKNENKTDKKINNKTKKQSTNNIS